VHVVVVVVEEATGRSSRRERRNHWGSVVEGARDSNGRSGEYGSGYNRRCRRSLPIGVHCCRNNRRLGRQIVGIKPERGQYEDGEDKSEHSWLK